MMNILNAFAETSGHLIFFVLPKINLKKSNTLNTGQKDSKIGNRNHNNWKGKKSVREKIEGFF